MEIFRARIALDVLVHLVFFNAFATHVVDTRYDLFQYLAL
jgi:hypothetical protein